MPQQNQSENEIPESEDIANHVAIVGAGPAGVAASRALKNLGIPHTVFEKNTDVGGLWDINNPGTPVYRSAHFISSKTMSGHVGFPMPEHYPDYPSNVQILNYIQNFADRYGLRENIEFDTSVESMVKANGGWHVTTQCNGENQTRGFRWVICASGTNWHPNRPDLPGEDSFTGEVIHSVEYRDEERLKGKRVLVIGAGNTAVDIACDAAFVAKEAYISFRRGYHFVPKHITGKPADVFAESSAWLPMKVQQFTFGLLLNFLNGDISRLGLPRPDHKPLESHPILNTQILHYLQHGDVHGRGAIDRIEGSTVHFKSGNPVEVDLIVLATGYDWSIPYLPKETFDWENKRPKTFAKIFNHKNPSIFLNGFLEVNGGIYSLMDEMGLAIAKTIDAQLNDPEKAKQIASFLQGPEPDMGGGIRYINSARHTGYANKQSFKKVMKNMRKRFGWPEPEQFYS